jgi:signal transduction histidine kinase
VFILLILFSFRLYRDLSYSFAKIEHSYQVLNEADGLLFHLTQAESHVGGYTLTHSEDYLHKFILSYQQVQQKMQLVGKLTRSNKLNADQQANFMQLEKFINEREKAFFERLNQQDSLQVSSIVEFTTMNYDGTAYLDKIRLVIGQMKDAEYKFLQNTKVQAKNQRELSFNLDIIACIGALALTFVTFFVLIKDSRKRKKIETNLTELNVNKDKFFSIVSHDLRGPAVNILKLSEFLLEENISDNDRKTMAVHMNTSAQNLHKLLENLLGWAKLQMGRLDINPSFSDLSNLTSENITQVSAIAGNKNIRIFNFVPEKTFAYADEKMCDTIIRNLLLNAIKFTNTSGTIKVSASDIGNYIEISVTDTGVGMSKEIMGKLFNIGTHFTSKGTANEHGSGLGLIICKELIEKNNGSIRVSSELNIGSTFTISIPKTPMKATA